MKVLYVDDDTKGLDIFEAVLKESGLTVLTANNLTDGKHILEEEKPDLIVSDGSIDFDHSHDGRFWAEELFHAGHKVILFSGMAYSELPEGMVFIMKPATIFGDVVPKMYEMLGISP